MLSEFEKAIALGIIEGLTEFLPVSSTGHLILFGSALEFTGTTVKTFSVFIQSGAILAVLILYTERFRGLLRAGVPGKGFSGWGGIRSIAVACAPAFILGALLHKSIKEHLFAPFPVAIAFIVGALVILWAERRTTPITVRTLDELPLQKAFLIGIFQCFGLWPGMSRSGSTIIAGVLLGLERRVAAEFSFIVGVPVLLAAAGYDLLRGWSSLTAQDLPLFAVGTFMAFLSAVLAIRIFIDLLARWGLVPFACYRIVFGIVVLLILSARG
jgi:undecaprenyl-diphosphatase